MNTEHELILEQCNARKDYQGKAHDTLGERLAADMSEVHDRFNKGSLIDYSGEYISARDSFTGSVTDMVVKGKTLQNLIKYINRTATITMTDTELTFTANGLQQTYYNDATLMENNKEYTLIFNILENSLNGNFRAISAGDTIQVTTVSSIVPPGITGLQKIKFTTKEAGIIQQYTMSTSTNCTSGYIKITKPVVLEGDWTDRDTPTYFEGIRSVGELDSDRNISISSCNKNIFDGEMESGYIDANTGVLITNSSRNRSKNYMKVEPNEQITVSVASLGSNAYLWIIGYDSNHNPVIDSIMPTYKAGIGYLKGTITSKTLTMTPTTEYIKWCCLEAITSENKLQIEKGLTTTAYEKYLSSEQNIALSSPLMSLPNGVVDTVSFAEKKKIIAIGKAVYDGGSTDAWLLYPDGENDTTVCFYKSVADKYKPASAVVRGLICDKFKNGALLFNVSCTEEGVCETSAYSTIYVRIAISKLRGYSASLSAAEKVNLFKTWLQANPITVYYQLAEPVEEDITEELLQLRSFDGITHIWSEGSLIQPDILCKVPTNVQAMISRLQVENANLLSDNTTLKASADRLSTESQTQEQKINDLNNVTDFLVQSSLL